MPQHTHMQQQQQQQQHGQAHLQQSPALTLAQGVSKLGARSKADAQVLAMNDVHALSDQDLADRLTFLEEVGSGNWGSVWKCRIKNGSEGDIVAVKLVHRSGGSNLKTSAARVRSLWNEMKTVRSFTQQAHAQSATSHPAIVPFSAFVITPSYALIEMPFFPRLVPVEVRESKARHWFRALADGVLFLHARGVVHNDIKPANILLTHADTPVLVDFGFAHRYDPTRREDAFISRLSYGTPEYLSPERAKGTPHDTRKSDVWALGVTFFEILEGRTPFERSDLSDSGGEVMATKEDLERYLARTVTGRWVGEWRLSPEVERLLRRMMAPTPSERATITSVVTDAYFAEPTPAPTPVPTPAPVSRTPKATNKAKAKAKAKSLVLNLGQPLAPSKTLSSQACSTAMHFTEPSENESDPVAQLFVDPTPAPPRLTLEASPSVPLMFDSTRRLDPQTPISVSFPSFGSASATSISVSLEEQEERGRKREREGPHQPGMHAFAQESISFAAGAVKVQQQALPEVAMALPRRRSTGPAVVLDLPFAPSGEAVEQDTTVIAPAVATATATRKQQPKPAPVASASQLRAATAMDNSWTKAQRAEYLIAQRQEQQWDGSGSEASSSVPRRIGTSTPIQSTSGKRRSWGLDSLRNSLANLRVPTLGRRRPSVSSSDNGSVAAVEPAVTFGTSPPLVEDAIRAEQVAVEEQIERTSLWIDSVRTQSSWLHVTPNQPGSKEERERGVHGAAERDGSPKPQHDSGRRRKHARNVPRAMDIFARGPTSPSEASLVKARYEDTSPVPHRTLTDQASSSDIEPSKRRIYYDQASSSNSSPLKSRFDQTSTSNASPLKLQPRYALYGTDDGYNNQPRRMQVHTPEPSGSANTSLSKSSGNPSAAARTRLASFDQMRRMMLLNDTTDAGDVSTTMGSPTKSRSYAVAGSPKKARSQASNRRANAQRIPSPPNSFESSPSRSGSPLEPVRPPPSGVAGLRSRPMTPVSPMPDQVSFRPHQTHFHQQSYAATPESERKTYFAPARSRQSVSPAISEGELQQRMFDGTGPRPQSSGHLEAMMDAAEKRQSLSRSPGLATEAALHRLFQDAPGAVQRVGAGFTNVTPSKTTKENFLSIISAAKSATQRLHKPEQERKRSHNKFFTSPDKDKRHVNPALADPQLNSTISGGQRAGGLHALVGRVAPDTTFDADDFAMVDHADSPHGTPNGKGGTIVRRAFKAFNNSMTLGRRMNKAV